MSDLKPCPFCGGEAKAYSDFSRVCELIYGMVECKSCGIKKRGKKAFDTYSARCEGYDTPEWVRNAHAEAKQSAIGAWNRRAHE